MKNKFITIIIAFITIFFSQSQVWANSENIKTQTKFNNIQIDKSVFLSLDDSPSIIAKRDEQVNKSSNSTWVASIFIVGLGQIMMGDFWRGFKFTLLTYGAITGAFIFAQPTLGLGWYAAYIITALYVIALAFYVWNIFDSYNMSQEQAGMSKLNDQEMAKIEKELKTVMDFATSVKVSDSGAVSVRALAF